MERLLVSVKEAADITSLHKNTLYKLVYSGEIQSLRVGKVIRIPVSLTQRMDGAGTAQVCLMTPLSFAASN